MRTVMVMMQDSNGHDEDSNGHDEDSNGHDTGH